MDDHVENCHLNFKNDKNQVTFIYVTASSPLNLVLFFINFLFIIHWTNITEILHHIYLLRMFLDEQFLFLEQLRLTHFVRFYLNYLPALILFYQGNRWTKIVDMTAFTPSSLVFISVTLVGWRDSSHKSINSV